MVQGWGEHTAAGAALCCLADQDQHFTLRIKKSLLSGDVSTQYFGSLFVLHLGI